MFKKPEPLPVEINTNMFTTVIITATVTDFYFEVETATTTATEPEPTIPPSENSTLSDPTLDKDNNKSFALSLNPKIFSKYYLIFLFIIILTFIYY